MAKMSLKKHKTSKKRTRKLKHCAPHIKNTGHSCFDHKALLRLAKIWNERHPDDLIITATKSNKELWNEINRQMISDYKCEDGEEWCWIDQKFFKNYHDNYLVEELEDYLKPLMPDSWNNNPREWLNTLDIEQILEQYQDKYKDFLFVGAVPIDFDSKLSFGNCVSNELCNINVKSLYRKGIRKIGVVFNLDKHNQSGSHWIAMFCNLSKSSPEVNYWDSYGMTPPVEVHKLMNRLQKQAKESLGITLKKQINKVRHQYKNTECGVYCIYFIISLLEGKKFKSVCSKIMDDDDMFEKRKQFFIED